MTNKELVLSYLQNGNILTAMDGFKRFGIVSVRDYISMLRADGVEIASEWRESLDTGKRWKEYFLVKSLAISNR